MQLQGEKTLHRFFLEFSIKQLFVLSFFRQRRIENPSEKRSEKAKQLKKDSEQVGMTT
jgi:hypothetical protein